MSDTRARLVEGLGNRMTWDIESAADALLPVVERIADERAAEALDRLLVAVNDFLRQPADGTPRGALAAARDEAASLRAASRGEEGL